MFNFGSDCNELVILGLLGLGLYAQSNEINLANNTTMLLALLLIFLEHEAIEELRHEVHHFHRFTDGRERGACAGGCGCGERFIENRRFAARGC